MRKILCNRKPVSGLHRTWSGTNFFSLSYYGFMRPDVLISYLFPHVEMEWFIQGYAIFEILLGGGLLYYWLHRKGFSDFTSFACGFFYLSANCFFQAHRQIMFVELSAISFTGFPLPGPDF